MWISLFKSKRVMQQANQGSGRLPPAITRKQPSAPFPTGQSPVSTSYLLQQSEDKDWRRGINDVVQRDKPGIINGL